MITKILMCEILDTAKENLSRYKSLDYPEIHIRSKKAKPFIISAAWRDAKSKEIAVKKIRKICKDVKAIETITVSDIFIHSPEEGTPPKDSLFVFAENRKRMLKVTLPYEIKPDGSVEFGEEDWSRELKKNKKEFGKFEEFIR